MLNTARRTEGVARRGVEQVAETLRVERERDAAGRTTANDLLDAEAAVREQRTRQEIARLDIIRIWVGLWPASGDSVPAQLMAVARAEREANEPDSQRRRNPLDVVRLFEEVENGAIRSAGTDHRHTPVLAPCLRRHHTEITQLRLLISNAQA